jgi:Ca2+-binding EF-hand superfamily protein
MDSIDHETWMVKPAVLANKKFATLLAFLACGFWSPPNPASALFEVLDRDDNGYITLEETEGVSNVRLRFSELDQNNNDQLEEAELQLSDIQLSFEHLDINRDLLVSYDEALALPRLSQNFSRLDQNNDQALSPVEFKNFDARD